MNRVICNCLPKIILTPFLAAIVNFCDKCKKNTFISEMVRDRMISMIFFAHRADRVICNILPKIVFPPLFCGHIEFQHKMQKLIILVTVQDRAILAIKKSVTYYWVICHIRDKLIRDNWNIIQNTEELNQIFSGKPIMGFRRLPNLRDNLTSAKIRYPPIEKPMAVKSHTPVCTRLGKFTYCPKIKKFDNITSFYTKKQFNCNNLPPRCKITCELSNLIYIINCSECDLQCIGETKRPLRQRMYEHFRSVQNKTLNNSTPVSRHFSGPNHSSKNMAFSVLHRMRETSNPNDTEGRRGQELFYIWAFPNLVPCRH